MRINAEYWYAYESLPPRWCWMGIREIFKPSNDSRFGDFSSLRHIKSTVMPAFSRASAARRGRGSAGYNENTTMPTRFPRRPDPTWGPRARTPGETNSGELAVGVRERLSVTMGGLFVSMSAARLRLYPLPSSAQQQPRRFCCLLLCRPSFGSTPQSPQGSANG